MPIYAYKCSACGHAQDVLRKMSDPLLTDCPECGQSTYTKQVTAAGFQLKGSGWYVTDFRNNGGGSAGATAADSAKGAGGAGDNAAPSSTPASPAAGTPPAATPSATASKTPAGPAAT
ncbi:FmdB family transcriptional regulator [Pollutimonas nitritireducens]|uniref:FmdB family transcriptional regulator n=1 Tax=Pollutimonas nitritireducens TaxID=2045209 RepID=A0A2N4ULF1_9BURK|nr:zinc ribbon domain-containing protein [Pollutimonas nitritireducens]PLC55854.1 FmdB family transcriptional regulator [Pollutimonas nitritireducens]